MINKKLLLISSLILLFIVVIAYILATKNSSEKNININQTDSAKGLNTVKIPETKSKDMVILLLQSPQTIIEKDKQFTVDIYLDTENITIRGGDVALKFDPKYLEIVDANSSKKGVQIIPGTLLAEPFVLSNEANNSTGQIFLSIGSLTPFKGKGVFGTIKLKAKEASASTNISFVAYPKTQFNKIDTSEEAMSIKENEGLMISVK